MQIVLFFYLDYIGKGTLKAVFTLARSMKRWVSIR